MRLEHKKIAETAEAIIDVFASNKCNVQEAHEAVRCAFSVVESEAISKKDYSEDVKRELSERFGDGTEGYSYRY